MNSWSSKCFEESRDDDSPFLDRRSNISPYGGKREAVAEKHTTYSAKMLGHSSENRGLPKQSMQTSYQPIRGELKLLNQGMRKQVTEDKDDDMVSQNFAKMVFPKRLTAGQDGSSNLKCRDMKPIAKSSVEEKHTTYSAKKLGHSSENRRLPKQSMQTSYQPIRDELKLLNQGMRKQVTEDKDDDMVSQNFAKMVFPKRLTAGQDGSSNLKCRDMKPIAKSSGQEHFGKLSAADNKVLCKTMLETERYDLIAQEVADLRNHTSNTTGKSEGLSCLPKLSDTKVENIAVTKATIVSAAIDIGTTHSGFAFSFKHDFKSDPEKIRTNEWNNCASGKMNMKVPTCVLLTPNKEFHSFGYYAKEKYEELSSEKEHEGWYFFWQFKMTLHQEEELLENYTIKEENGKFMDALTVFSHCIKFLKDYLMTALSNAGTGVKQSELTWVVTVPAIWNDSAKKFMRKAAEMTGIPKENLEIALEPEAASLYCRTASKFYDPSTETDLANLPPGTNYMILDCGGGTVDITVHEVLKDGKLREKYQATGGPWGGSFVNKAFWSFISRQIGNDTSEKFAKDNKQDYLEMMDTFEDKKRMTTADVSDTVFMRIPTEFANIWRNNVKNKIDDQTNVIKVQGDKMRIPKVIFKSFFQPAIDGIVNHVQQLKESLPFQLQAILMVGGFSDSPLLQKAIKDVFENDVKIIIPFDASLCVLKGAVLYGHQPMAISERKSRYTYGVAMVDRFEKGKHPEHKKIQIGKELLCNDLFDKHVEIGETVAAGHVQAERTYFTISENDTVYPIIIYRTTQKDPQFIDECEYVTSYSVTKLGKGRQPLEVRFIFGNSDITVQAVQPNGTVSNVDFNF